MTKPNDNGSARITDEHRNTTRIIVEFPFMQLQSKPGKLYYLTPPSIINHIIDELVENVAKALAQMEADTIKRCAEVADSMGARYLEEVHLLKRRRIPGACKGYVRAELITKAIRQLGESDE